MNHVNAARRTDGFTLIELMLAMTFISVLLLAIAMTIIQVGAMYNRGTTLKETDQTARIVVDGLQRDIKSSEGFSTTADYFSDNVSGRLCLGNYTYIWNYGKAQSNSTRVKYLQASKASTPIYLVKVVDSAKLYCAKDVNNNFVQPNILAADTTRTKELLATGDHALAIHKFVVTPGTATTTDPLTKQQLYQLQFTLGTNNIAALDATQSQCLPPTDPKSDINYCSVQDFSLVVRTGNGFN